MQSLVLDSTFRVFEVATVLLVLNLLVVCMYSAVALSKSKTAVNEEDGKAFGVGVVDKDPPEVARVLRAHANALANIVPFLALGLVYLLAGGDSLAVKIIFGVFTAARLLHSVVYLAGKQPWRTVTFLVGLLSTLALLGFVVWDMIRA